MLIPQKKARGTRAEGDRRSGDMTGLPRLQYRVPIGGRAVR
jgi:hypothetical protein